MPGPIGIRRTTRRVGTATVKIAGPNITPEVAENIIKKLKKRKLIGQRKK